MENICKNCPTTKMLYALIEAILQEGTVPTGVRNAMSSIIDEIDEFKKWYESVPGTQDKSKSASPVQKYALVTVTRDLSEDIELPAGAKILEVLYEARNGSEIWPLGSWDRVVAFGLLKEKLFVEYDHEKRSQLKSQYQMNMPDIVFVQADLKRVVRILVPRNPGAEPRRQPVA